MTGSSATLARALAVVLAHTGSSTAVSSSQQAASGRDLQALRSVGKDMRLVADSATRQVTLPSLWDAAQQMRCLGALVARFPELRSLEIDGACATTTRPAGERIGYSEGGTQRCKAAALGQRR